MPENKEFLGQRDHTTVKAPIQLPIEPEEVYYGGELPAAYVQAKLPSKFHGSQLAAKRYSEGYYAGRRVAETIDKAAPYVAAALTMPLDIAGALELGATAPIVFKGIKNIPLAVRNFQDWSRWSKAGKISPRNMLEYRHLEANNGLRGIDVAHEAKLLGVDPHAYIQIQSRPFKRFLRNADFKVQYHGTPVKNATVFPKPSDPDYLGKVPGTGTYEEGIYVTGNPRYADRYTKAGIGVYDGPVTGEVHQVAVGGNPTSISELSAKGINNKWSATSFQHMSSEQRKIINDLGT